MPARSNASYLVSAVERVPRMNGKLGLIGQGRPDVKRADRLFDRGENTLPELLSPARQATGVYVGTRDGHVHVLDRRAATADIVPPASVRRFLDQMPVDR